MKTTKFLSLLLIAAASTGFYSCSDDNEEVGKNPEFQETVSGIYVVNQGNFYSGLPGSLTSYDFSTKKATQEAFKAVNSVGLGDTPMSALIHGSKMYIAVYESNLIWVVNPNTLKVEKSIKPDAPASSPRYLAAKDGYVYASMYTGQVCRIDTVSLAIDKTINVGPNPEQMAILGNNLYVANSDGMNWQANYANGSVSIVDLSSLSERKIKVGVNPCNMATNGTDVFVLCMGDYAAVPSTIKRISGDSAVDIAPGSFFAVSGNEIYAIDAPYGKSVSYKVYSTAGAELRNMVADPVDMPASIAVDPVSGDIVILSYKLDADGTTLYEQPCYARIYDKAGNTISDFNTGVGSFGIAFNHSFVSK